MGGGGGQDSSVVEEEGHVDRRTRWVRNIFYAYAKTHYELVASVRPPSDGMFVFRY